MFVYNFDSEVNFCGENLCRNFFPLELFLRIVKKIAKVGTRINLAPHGIYLFNI